MNYGSISLQKSCINNFRGIFANAFSQLLLEEGILEAPIFGGKHLAACRNAISPSHGTSQLYPMLSAPGAA